MRRVKDTLMRLNLVEVAVAMGVIAWLSVMALGFVR